jgi:phosphoribosylanthranilate isomerase
VFAPSVRQISAQRVYDITRRLPPEILTIGVFRDEHPKRVVEIVHRSGVKGAQLHGNESHAAVAAVAKGVQFVVKAYTAGSSLIARAASLATDTILIDGSTPGSGHLFDWSLVGEIPAGVRMILAGGLTPENIADAVQTVNPWGVDVASGVESAPGKKDALALKRFVERARAAAPVPYLGPEEIPYDWSDE